MKQINLRVDDALLQAVDDARGHVPRNQWLLDAITGRLNAETVDTPETVAEKMQGVRATQKALGRVTADPVPDVVKANQLGGPVRVPKLGHAFKPGKRPLWCECGHKMGEH